MMNRATWTSFIDPRLTLKEIIIPMTHDSATASLTDNNFSRKDFRESQDGKLAQTALSALTKMRFSRKIIMDAAITQANSPGVSFLTDQMNQGIRAFDLRIFCGEDNEHQIKYQHGPVVWNVTVLESFYHLANNFRFPNEIMILRLSHFMGPEARNANLIMRFLEKVQVIFREKLCMRNAKDNSSFEIRTLAELRSTPIIIILDARLTTDELTKIRTLFKWVHFSNLCYDDGYTLVRQHDVGLNANEVINYCYGITNLPWSIKLTQTQMHLQMNPDLKDILKLDLPNIRQWTTESGLNNRLLKVIDDLSHHRNFNVASFDFVTPQIVDKIMSINIKRNRKMIDQNLIN